MEGTQRKRERNSWLVNSFGSAKENLSTDQFAVVMLAIATVLDIVQVVAGLLAQQPQLLGTGHVKLLPTSGLVALHTRTHCRLRALVQLLANVTRCKVTESV